MINENSQLVSRINQWSDFDLSFDVNPDTFNLLLKKDVASIKQSLRNLLLTKKGERPFHQNYGSNIYNYLHEPIDIVTQSLLENEISVAINNHEPRVKLLNVLVEEVGTNTIRIIIECEIKNPDRDTFNLNLSLERVR